MLIDRHLKVWVAEKIARVKATWEQINLYANMTASSLKLWDNA